MPQPEYYKIIAGEEILMDPEETAQVQKQERKLGFKIIGGVIAVGILIIVDQEIERHNNQ